MEGQAERRYSRTSFVLKLTVSQAHDLAACVGANHWNVAIAPKEIISPLSLGWERAFGGCCPALNSSLAPRN